MSAEKPADEDEAAMDATFARELLSAAYEQGRQAGAEEMREACIKECCEGRAETWQECAEAIRAMPLPEPSR